MLRLSVRQVRRIRRAVERAGRAGLAARQPRAGAGEQAAGRWCARGSCGCGETKYVDFNDQHFTEKLAAETPPLRVSVRTVRRVLRAAGMGAVRAAAPAEAPAPPRAQGAGRADAAVGREPP